MIEPWDTCGSCRNILGQGVWVDRESYAWINTLDGIGIDIARITT